MSSQDRTTSGAMRGGMSRALSAGVILTISLGIYVGTVGRSVGQTGTSTADVCATDVKSDPLQVFARKCFDAVGEDVPGFDCDDGTEVPENNFTGGSYPNGSCDAPNVLTGVCDQHSHFQVLKETNDVAIVGHCRKKGNADHEYGDIAVIQYNKKNGAICFYQALQGRSPSTGPLPAKISAPIKGNVGKDENGNDLFPWLDPVETAKINCVGCHDSGPFIRSPYLAQLRKEPKNRLPGTNEGAGPWDQRFSWNQTLPLSFVGNDFQSWKTYALSITGAGSGCLGCHRLGFSQSNGLYNGGAGTAQNFALIATDVAQSHKNVHSPDSPIWMTPDRSTLPGPPPQSTAPPPQYSAGNRTEAEGAAACASAIVKKLNNPDAPSPPQGCQYSQFGRGNSCVAGPIQATLNGATQSDPTGGRSDVTVTLGSCSDPSKCPPGFCYWRSVHGPFWQKTPFSVPIADTNYRGNFIRIYAENGLWMARAFGDPTGLPPNAASGGTAECTVYNEIAAVPDVSKCFANQFEVIDKDGTTVSGAVDATVAGLSTANVLSGYIGNIAQSNLNAQGDRPDTLQVFESSGKVRLTQVHGLNPPSPFKPGPLKGESWTNGCVSWTPNYLAKNVHTTSDVQLLTPAQTQNARCFITGVTGAWSSTRNNATVQPFAEIYYGTSKEARLHVSPTSGDDRVGAFASCIQLK